jgi:hypothetical protein
MKAKAGIAAIVAVAVTGCGSSGHEQPAPVRSVAKAVQTKAPRALVKPTIHFNGPRVIHSNGSFKTTVALSHFHLAPQLVGKAPVPGMGHLHFMLAGGKFDYPRYSGPNGVLGKKLGVAGAYSPAVTPNIAYSHLPPGHYTLVCMLANNNHTPVGVEAKETIVVK